MVVVVGGFVRFAEAWNGQLVLLVDVGTTATASAAVTAVTATATSAAETAATVRATTTASATALVDRGAYDGRLAAALRRLGALDGLEHGRVLEHVRQDDEADLAAAYVDLLELGSAAVTIGDRDVAHQTVHVVLGFDELAAEQLAHDRLHGHDVTFRFVQHFDRDSDRHLSVALLFSSSSSLG